MNGKSCFFIGHCEAPDTVLPLLQEAVNKHIENDGVTEFIVGHYGNFDYLAAKAVIAAKQLHPEITLSLLIPYHPAARPIKKPKGFDNTYYPPGMENVPRKLAIIRANRYMVDHVDFLITYAWHPASNARELVEYAEKKMEKGVIQVTNYSLMTDEEVRYASNPLTHLDFLLFNKMDKKPIMAIEIDGTRYHAEGSRQAERDLLKNSVMEKYGLPLLRIRTNESDVENRIISKLRESLS